MIDNDFLFELAITTWSSALEEIPDEWLWKALKEVIGSSQFPPTPALIIEICRKYKSSEQGFYGPGHPMWEENREWEQRRKEKSDEG